MQALVNLECVPSGEAWWRAAGLKWTEGRGVRQGQGQSSLRLQKCSYFWFKDPGEAFWKKRASEDLGS